ncbi:dermonecrotic toxin domain-containing protein [Pseudomonas fildesensis]|uniref:dermonecrotic toxin domain-containing protein n=1 Tax=Pseudomonas fildesensis TaxID=1674920 RepID=UPI00387B1892
MSQHLPERAIERLLPVRDLHHDVLKNAIPDWLGTASASRRHALKTSAPTSPAGQDPALKPLIRQAWITQNQLDSALDALQSPADFAAPVLQQALKQRFGVEQDVRSTYLRLYVPASVPWFPIRTGATRAWTVSLLDAALHNFQASETADDAYERNSAFITQPTATGRFDTLPDIATRLSIPDFTRLCRELDLGAQYNAYLERYLDLNNPVARTYLRQRFDASQIASLKVAMHMARINGDLSEAHFLRLQQLLHNPEGCDTLRCHALSIMNSTLTGIVLFTTADLERARHEVPVIAYIPDAPQRPLKTYNSSTQFMQALTADLRQPAYQQFFSRFVNHDERGHFFADLGQRLSRVTWHPHTRGDPRPTWRDTPVDTPELQFSVTPVNGSVLAHLYQTKLSKLFNDARTQAVSTASADQKTRWERWSLFEKIGSAVLQIAVLIAAPFIPPLGLAMLGYTAYQLLDDAFEGIIDWAEGLKTQAFGHLMSVLEQMVQLGMFAVGLPIAEGLLRQHLPAEIWQFFDRFKPVTLPDGQSRLWQPDLTPYAQDVTLPKGSSASPLGLHPHGEQDILPLSGKHYALGLDPVTQTHYFEHPSRPNAYRPTVTSNGQGTWVSELDQPLSWDSATLMRRLGHQVESFTDAQLEQIRQISGIDDSALRKLYVTHQTLPPLLADTLKRFKIDQDLHTFIRQMNSDDPAVQALANPQTQLLLLTNYGLWPSSKTLRLIDSQGRTRWEIPGSNGASVAQLHEAQMRNGELLKTVLEALDEPQRKTLLEEAFGLPASSLDARTRTLRKKLAQLAQDKRWSLFESAYRGVERTDDTQLTTLIDASPGLPVSAAETLRAIASTEELRAIDQGQVPPRLRALAEETLQEVRSSRAYEGLYLDNIDNNLDTHRLALHTLPDLPNWPAQLRIEVRNDTLTGTLRDAIGDARAATQRTLIFTANGDYVPADSSGELFGETDFYTALLQALPDQARNTVGIHIGQGPVLRQAIARHALHHSHLRALLSGVPTGKPAYDPSTMRLRGGMHGYRLAPAPGPLRELTPHEQAQQLFPALPHTQIDSILRNLQPTPGGLISALTALRVEYQQLEYDLNAWVNAAPRLAPDSQGRQELAYARHSRQAWAYEMRRAWRLETPIDDYYEPPIPNGYQLHLRGTISGLPPVISARFAHISHLTLEGEQGPLEINVFLSTFPMLRRLTVRTINLGRLPENIPSMPALKELTLSDCNITLSPSALASLSNMTALESLDLFNNPLGQVPSVERMQDLNFLDLSNTGISELPAGVLQRQHLETALFKENRIHTLPAALFELPVHTSHSYDFSGNPLSRQTLEQVKAYFQRTGSYWEVDADPVDTASAKMLFPRFTRDGINRLIFGLPGNLESGKIELARLELDYQNLGRELDVWVRTPDIGETESGRREAFKHTLLAGWRREIPQDEYSNGVMPTYELEISAPINGTLPTLSTRFNHVSSLTLSGDQSALKLERLLESFPALQTLVIKNYSLGDIPEPIFQQATLTVLSLEHCNLRLSASSTKALEGMTALEQLNLSDNPLLGQVPNVAHMKVLTRLRLQNTGISEIPASLLDNRQSELVDLSHNAIKEIPPQLFERPASVTRAFDLSANPLSPATLQRLKGYCQRTGEHLRADAADSEHTRIAALYPSFTTSEVNRFIFSVPGDMEAIPGEITRLENEYATLDADLTSWALNVPQRHPLLDVVLDEQARAEEQIQRFEIKRLLEEGWRRESEIDALNGGQEATHKMEFDTPILGDLPDLSARFEHVSLLELRGLGTTTNVEGVARCFPNVTTLLLDKYTLGDIPTRVFNLRRLTSLTLTECRIRLGAEAAAKLRDLHNLEYLDLSDNPLSQAPALDNMPKLETLYLQNCGLSEVPVGVFDRPRLSTVDLSDNAISDIPANLLQMSRQWNDDSDLSGNPLSVESLNHLRQYFRQTGNDLQVDEAAVNDQGQPLTPPPTPEPMEE